MRDSAPFRGVWGHAPPGNFLRLGPLRLILMQSGPIWEVKIAIIFHLFFYMYDKELQLVKITC